jgi:hypothetical protein
LRLSCWRVGWSTSRQVCRRLDRGQLEQLRISGRRARRAAIGGSNSTTALTKDKTLKACTNTKAVWASCFGDEKSLLLLSVATPKTMASPSINSTRLKRGPETRSSTCCNLRNRILRVVNDKHHPPRRFGAARLTVTRAAAGPLPGAAYIHLLVRTPPPIRRNP